jgi:hypothetical protein
MYNEQLEKLIEMALLDGVLTEKEKQVLFKKAESFGVDLDEFEMVLDSKLFEIQKKAKSESSAVPPLEAAPKSDKFGDVRKCPSCASVLQSFQTKCDDCGHEFRNIDAVGSSQKLFDLLQSATLRNSKALSENEEQKNKRLELLSQKHNSDGSLVKIFGGKSRAENQDEEREDLIREMNKGRKTIEKSLAKEKANIIKNFPVPNSREDLLELLAMASSNAYDNDGHVGHEEEVWIQKTDQIYSKVKVSSDKDPELLDQATNMVVSLMKKLPSKYKKFTTFPESIKGKIQSELDGDKQRRRENQIKAGKPYAIATGSTILLMIISGLFNGGGITFIFFVLTVVSISLLVRAVKKSNEINF